MIWKSAKDKPIHLILSDEDVRDQLVQLLGKLSYKVKIFENADDFINEPIAETPACLITEVKSDGLDAVTLIKQMREHGLATPVVVVADGSHSVNTAVKAIQAGATDFIEQPIIERDFLERMKTILNKNN